MRAPYGYNLIVWTTMLGDALPNSSEPQNTYSNFDQHTIMLEPLEVCRSLHSHDTGQS